MKNPEIPKLECPRCIRMDEINSSLAERIDAQDLEIRSLRSALDLANLITKQPDPIPEIFTTTGAAA